jgi:hypothetical protein
LTAIKRRSDVFRSYVEVPPGIERFDQMHEKKDNWNFNNEINREMMGRIFRNPSL